MTAAESKRAKEKATKLHSLIVRARGYCEACGGTRGLQCAHIVSRRYSATRTDLTNAFALCAGCHMRFTEWPVEFTEFIDRTIGRIAYDELHVRSLSRQKVDWQAEVERLTPLAKQVA